MKCRLYLNETSKKRVEEAFDSLRIIHNSIVYDLFTNFANTKERTAEDGNIIHYANKLEMVKSHYYKKFRPDLEGTVPAGAISGKNGIIQKNLWKSLEMQSKNKSKSGKMLPIESLQPSYYTQNRPVTSMTYQESPSKFYQKENNNTIYFNLPSTQGGGKAKIRGWNKNISFDENGESDLISHLKNYPKNKNGRTKAITISIMKDKCNDYYIVFSLADAYKKVESNVGKQEIGVDVGIKDIAITSDGEKYENKHFAKQEKRHLRRMNRRMSRRWGSANEEFRKERKDNKWLIPSKGYNEARLACAKVHRDITRKRGNWNHNISMDIVRKSSVIGVESLNIKGMFSNRHLAAALADAAMYQLLEELKYKAGWYGREIYQINQWKPSSKTCNNCGYIKKDLTLSIREWICPVCGERHDRDVNAAKNIIKFALEAK